MYSILACRAYTVIANLVILKIISTNYTGEQFGVYVLSLTLFTLLNQTFFGPIAGSLIKFNSQSKSAYQKAKQKVLCCKSVALYVKTNSLIIIIVSFYLCIKSDYIITLLSICLAFSMGFINLYETNLNSEKRVKEYSVFQLSTYSFRLLIILVVALYSNKLIILYIGYILANSLSLLYPNYKNLKFIKIVFKKCKFKTISLDNYLNHANQIKYWGIFTFAFLSSEKYIVEHLLNLKQVANLGVINQIAVYPIILLTGVLNTYYSPYLLGETNNKKYKYYKKSYLLVLTIVAVISLIVIITLPTKIVLVLTDIKYIEISKILWLFMLYALLSGYVNLFNFDQLRNGHLKQLRNFKIGSSLVCIIINFALTLKLQLIGLGIGNITWAFANLLYSCYLNKYHDTKTVKNTGDR